jgi:stage III sporulation protein SpoIIIAA
MKIETLDEGLQRRILKAKREPLVLTAEGNAVLVVRNVLDDDVVDDLIVENPEFRRTIELARKQKAQGLVKTLAEVRRKYK